MDDLGWRRWQEFSERMARTCFADSKEPGLDFILSEVHHFFDCCGKWEIAAFKSWDNSDEYPRESGYSANDRRCKCWWRDGGRRPSHNGQDPDCDTCGGDPDWRPMSTGSLPCDTVMEQESGSIPFWECGRCQRDSLGDVGRYYAGIEAGLDTSAAGLYRQWRCAEYLWWKCSCDVDRYAWEEDWLDQWFGPVRCCLRSGIDFAGDASAGVIGFTAKDVRDMWPEGVPEWVFGKDQKLSKGPLAGPLVENGTFSSLPDETHLIL